MRYQNHTNNHIHIKYSPKLTKITFLQQCNHFHFSREIQFSEILSSFTLDTIIVRSVYVLRYLFMIYITYTDVLNLEKLLTICDSSVIHCYENESGKWFAIL